MWMAAPGVWDWQLRNWQLEMETSESEDSKVVEKTRSTSVTRVSRKIGELRKWENVEKVVESDESGN
jgi:hypothetical protein